MMGNRKLLGPNQEAWLRTLESGKIGGLVSLSSTAALIRLITTKGINEIPTIIRANPSVYFAKPR